MKAFFRVRILKLGQQALHKPAAGTNILYLVGYLVPA